MRKVMLDSLIEGRRKVEVSPEERWVRRLRRIVEL